jgi:predicted amidohydrolase YtcJ
MNKIFADMAVLSHNIFEIHPVKIKGAYCTMTIKGGKIVYKK